MSERVIDFLVRLAPRERLLLGVLGLVVVPAAVVLGWLWPLHEARQTAEAELVETRALDAWVMERQAEKAGLSLPSDGREVPEAIGVSALEQSLISSNLRPFMGGLETRDDGEIALRFDEVNFVDLMRWMDRQDPEWGYRIAALRIERGDRSAYVEARLTLVPEAQ
ncbi:MAG: type II secretion system protein GspM [Roseovarius sp.]